MWQDLYDSLNADAFIVIAVAEDSGGPATTRPWIEKANSTYPCLIDTDHRVAALYGMVNVPQCVWINETGRIVRPPETAGSTDHFRRMDRTTQTMSAEDQAARAAARVAYMAAVRDWALTGRHALSTDRVREALPRVTEDMALAEANFRLGIWLRRNGRADDAVHFLAEASRLHPSSWSMWRQAAEKDGTGLASGQPFWDRLQALGDKPYYPQPDLPGF